MNAQVAVPKVAPNDSTERAQQESLLSPRFYTTDFKALEKLDLSPVRESWDRMMDEYRRDGNVDHFKRDASFEEELRELPEPLRSEFIDFMITSVTSEYSGCELYQEIEKRVNHPELKELMAFMARDEARHAGFINRALKDFGVAVDLGFLKREKKHTFFKPKFIFYATYLSEKIGYARYITIYRHLEKHPEKRFHPIYRWFLRWCNDEFRHGESFALIMRANPSLLSGLNRLWIRFFLLAVYSTMFVRDHSRTVLHDALGIDVEEYDYTVFDITTEISRQVFPLTLDTDSPRFRAGLTRLVEISQALERSQEAGGLLGPLYRLGLRARGALTFVQLYLHPVKENALPDDARMQPAW